MIKIIVCLKLVMDPEAPLSLFKIDRDNMKPVPPEGLPPVMNPFDENALEAALRIKDQIECKVTVMSLGKSLPKAILLKSLAVGADELIALEDPEFEQLDPFNTANALACAIKKNGEYDLIFTGRQAADWDAGLVWAGITEVLDLPSITLARKADIHDGKALIERVSSDGIDVLEVELPALISFSNEVGALRNFSLPALVKAKKQGIIKWTGADIGWKKEETVTMDDIYIPDLGMVDCHFIQGDNLEENGRKLALKLAESDLILEGI